MAWYAVDAIDDALGVTRSFLFPFSWGRWLRLAAIVLFLGGGNSVNLPSDVPSMPRETGTPPTALDPSTARLLVLLVAALVVLGVVLAVVSAVMRFVFLDALRTDEVRVRRPFRRRFWMGIRFLLFNLVVGLLLVAGVVMLVIALTAGGVAVLGAIDPPDLQLGAGVAGAVVLGLVALVLVVGLVAFFHFTRAFVAPTMVATERGVLASWGRFWDVLRAEPWQFAVYLVVRLLLNIAVAIAAGIVTAVAGGVVVIGGLVVGLAIVLAFGGLSAATQSTAGLVAIGVVAALTLAVLLVLVILPVRIVVQTFLTGYELAVLGDADTDLAILADFGLDDGDRGAADTGDEPGRGPVVVEAGDPIEPAGDTPEAGDEGESVGDESAFVFGQVEDADEPGGDDTGDSAGDDTDDDTDGSDDDSASEPYWRDS